MEVPKVSWFSFLNISEKLKKETEVMTKEIFDNLILVKNKLKAFFFQFVGGTHFYRSSLHPISNYSFFYSDSLFYSYLILNYL